MTPFVWVLGVVLWLAAWGRFASRRVASSEGDALIIRLASLSRAFTISTCLAAFVSVPDRRPVFHQLVLWAHHAGFYSLFLFLAVAQYLQAEAWWRSRLGGSSKSAAAAIRRLWVLTEIAPAPIALAVLLTGLRLIWESPQENSPSKLWLLVLIVGFSVLFWDGILGYQPIVRKMQVYWLRVADGENTAATARRGWPYVGDSLQLLLHFLSWPLLFLFGVVRWNSADSLTEPVARVIHQIDRLRVFPSGWPEVITALLLWLAAGLAVLLIRSFHRSSRSLLRRAAMALNEP